MQMTPPVRRRRRSAFSFFAAGAVPTVTSFAAAVIVTALLLAVPARAFSSSLPPLQSSSTRRAAPFRCVGSRRFAMSMPSSSSSSDAGGTMTNGRDGFTEKKAFESRIAAIERTAASTLEGFYDPRLKSFSVKPGGNVNVSDDLSNKTNEQVWRVFFVSHLAPIKNAHSPLSLLISASPRPSIINRRDLTNHNISACPSPALASPSRRSSPATTARTTRSSSSTRKRRPSTTKTEALGGLWSGPSSSLF